MKNFDENELRKIENAINLGLIKNITPIHGGSINQAFKFSFDSEKVIFIKLNSLANSKLHQFEFDCLNELIQYGNNEYLEIPSPYCHIRTNKHSLLILPWINIQSINQKNLGKGIGLLHKISSSNESNKFGSNKDGFIGTNLQIKGWHNEWHIFFSQFRIKPQVKLLNQRLFTKINEIELCKKIEKSLYKHKPLKCLVHGDLWNGNAGSLANEKGVIFDPSSWWADSEVDIAMTMLFGGFTEEFYQGYQEINKFKDGFEERAKIYNLYHLLNHANMFGGSYIDQSLTNIKYILNK